MLHTKTVTPEVLQLIKELQQKLYLEEFYLVGGTGLALQIGHRKSDDICCLLFSITDPAKLTWCDRSCSGPATHILLSWSARKAT